MKKKSGKKNSGFPITNVGNDRRGFLSGMTGDLLLGMTEGVLFVWERGVLMTCVMRTMRQPAFSSKWPNPAGSLPVTPAGSPPCHTRRPLSVMPAGPSLSCLPVLLYHARRPPSVIPAVFSGNPVKTVFPQGSIRESYSFDKASMTSE